MLKKYRLGFDGWGLLLFAVIMLPNFVWFAVPAPRDVLRAASVTAALDAFASVCQMLMVAALCVLIRKDGGKLRLTPLIAAAGLCCAFYYASWAGYYAGAVNAAVLLGLTLFPCAAFVLFAMDRKNRIALALGGIFMICHLLYAVVNFII